MDYRRNFIELLAPLERVPEEITKGQFLNGLKEEIKVEVRLLGPKNLDNAMDLALMVEDKLRVGSNKKWEQKSGGYTTNRSLYQPSMTTYSQKGSVSNYSTGSSPRTYVPTYTAGATSGVTRGSSKYQIRGSTETDRCRIAE